MAKYMIHTYPKRNWYVNEYLIPSMLAQGIDKVDITIYNDSKGDGNLRSCMNAFAMCTRNGGTWHLQDDVCICKDFKQRTEEYDDGIVCGFCSWYDEFKAKNAGPGITNVTKMWYSFPCIRIPNDYARECSSWVTENLIGNPIYQSFWESGVNDDWCFRSWINTNHKDDTALNLAPNLVDHIDYLLGGGSGGTRDRQIRSTHWQDEDIVRELEEKINGRA